MAFYFCDLISLLHVLRHPTCPSSETGSPRLLIYHVIDSDRDAMHETATGKPKVKLLGGREND